MGCNEMGTDGRFEFGSNQWLEMVQHVLTTRLSDPATPDMVVCEVYHNLPRHLAPDGEYCRAWTLQVRDGVASFSLTECSDDEAWVKVVGDYDALLPIARFVVSDDNVKAYRALWDSGESDQRILRVRDNRPAQQSYAVHNEIARQTR